MSLKSSSCVMCFKNLEDDYLSSNSIGALDQQLLVIFFLEKFLKYRLVCEDLELVLINQGNPSEWIQFCSPCSKTVQKALKVHRLLAKLEIQLDTLRGIVEKKVADSFDEILEKSFYEKKNKTNGSLTVFSVRKAIYMKGIQLTRSNSTLLEVNVKEECFSDTEDQWAEEALELSKIKDHIIVPDCELLKSVDEDDDIQEDRKEDLLSSLDLSTLIRGRSTTSRKNQPKFSATTNRKNLTSFYKKKSYHHGPKKSSISSRTCPICHLVFDKPSRMTRHFKSHRDLSQNANQTLSVKLGSKNLPLAVSEPITSMDEENAGAVSGKGEVVKRQRRKKPIAYSIKDYDSDNSNGSDSSEHNNDSRKAKKLNDGSDSEYSIDVGELGSDSSGDEHTQSDGSITKNDMDKALKGPSNSSPKKRSSRKTNPEERTCPICNKIFTQPRTMLKHLKGVHEKPEIYVCEVCGKKYSWQGALNKHKKKHDDGWIDVRPLKCEFEGCNKTFRHNSDKIRHEKIHLPDKDYLCSICGKSFTELSCLRRHNKIHQGVKEHLCNICNERFRHKTSLLRHNLFKHQKDAPKPFICEQCGKSFKVKTHLDQHLKSVTHGGPGFSKNSSSNSINVPKKRMKKNLKELPPNKREDLLNSVHSENDNVNKFRFETPPAPASITSPHVPSIDQYHNNVMPIPYFPVESFYRPVRSPVYWGP